MLQNNPIPTPDYAVQLWQDLARHPQPQLTLLRAWAERLQDLFKHQLGLRCQELQDSEPDLALWLQQLYRNHPIPPETSMEHLCPNDSFREIFMHDLKQDSRQVRIAQNFQALGAALVLPQLKTLRTDLWAAQEATAIPSANAALGVLLERVWRDVHHKLKSLVLKMTYEKDLSKAEESLINQLRQEQPRTKKKLKY